MLVNTVTGKKNSKSLTERNEKMLGVLQHLSPYHVRRL